MAKKSKLSALSILYFLGMALTVAGFCLPMITGPFKGTYNGFKFIDFDHSSFVTIGAVVLFVGACVGALIGLLGLLRIKVPTKKLLALLALVAVLVGILIIVIGFANGNGFYKFMGKQLFKHLAYGSYMVCAGWIISAVGFAF